MSDGPKLYTNKPKKAQLKPSQKQHQASSPTPPSSATMSSSSSTSPGTRPPPQPPKESFARRYKFMWPLLLAVNFTVGGVRKPHFNPYKEEKKEDDEARKEMGEDVGKRTL